MWTGSEPHTRQSDVGMNKGGLRQQQKGPLSLSGLTGSLEDENEAESDSIPSLIHARHFIFPFTFLRHCGDLVRQASYVLAQMSAKSTEGVSAQEALNLDYDSQ